MKNIRIYDNGGKTFDRFTAVYMDSPEIRSNTYSARAMSAYPFHPQGFGQFCMAVPGRHLGKRIKFEDLPQDCQRLIKMDLKD